MRDNFILFGTVPLSLLSILGNNITTTTTTTTTNNNNNNNNNNSSSSSSTLIKTDKPLLQTSEIEMSIIRLKR